LVINTDTYGFFEGLKMFKKSFVYLVLSSFVLMGASLDAEAKRMGGSKSVGKQSQSVTQKQQAAPAQPAQAPTAAPASAAKPATAPAAAQPKKGFGMGGILGGLAAGLGLGWLLSHFGMGEAAASFLMGFLMVAAVAMIGLWLFRRFANKGQASYKASPAGGAPWENQQRPDRQEPVNFGSSSASPVAEVAAPEVAEIAIKDFDQESFLLNAKKHFVHLQEAWDRGDLEKLREFATPEMFAELNQDLQARATEQNRTEVVTIEADLLGVESLQDVYLASVRFSGMIREQANGPAESFVEVWNLTKPVNGQGGWVLAGIQQLV
jgi:predicted lipid-binding transport protein (Tim44 family)